MYFVIIFCKCVSSVFEIGSHGTQEDFKCILQLRITLNFDSPTSQVLGLQTHDV